MSDIIGNHGNVSLHLHGEQNATIKFYDQGVPSSPNPYVTVSLKAYGMEATVFVNTPEQAQALAEAFAEAARLLPMPAESVSVP